ncbi:ATP synthase F1 subunit gamma [Rickettsia endosymbiont of Cardiosporidium cionae]|uniref:ATP synthase F1 subunit gamma n=1 Tax=Rickettsia endosymbiont of Cardiosporidium cionae TaxID=2777155 RepID=UPI001892F5EA|nr:ATP synthase F1 subunit gamma [Rickettsia endosymbiont of Cardiosporidium cionae]KAF8818465.1 F0F1 ATP synthase subunit gamma [Rickettsia endosymbiont of Cardiosporidium cionae]
MASLKDIKNKIKSVSATQRITKAMELVASAKLKKIEKLAKKFNKSNQILSDLIYGIIHSHDYIPNFNVISNKIDSVFFERNLINKTHLLIIFTSDRGLCGNFNSAIINAVQSDIELLKHRNKKVKLIIFGTKGYEALCMNYTEIILEYHPIHEKNFELIAKYLANRIKSLVLEGVSGPCDFYYYQFINVLKQKIVKKSIFPVRTDNQLSSQNVMDYRYNTTEYEGDDLLGALVYLYLLSESYYGLLENIASEEAMRRVTMENASTNARELIKDFTLELNRKRQYLITKELIEVVSGFESL